MVSLDLTLILGFFSKATFGTPPSNFKNQEAVWHLRKLAARQKKELSVFGGSFKVLSLITFSN